MAGSNKEIFKISIKEMELKRINTMLWPDNFNPVYVHKVNDEKLLIIGSKHIHIYDLWNEKTSVIKNKGYEVEKKERKVIY